MFDDKDSGNWNSKPGITGLSFSGGVKQFFHIRCERIISAGLRIPLQPFMRKLLDRLRLSPGQLAPNA